MGRGPRIDRPGMRHHVYNRGLARRTLFEYREDVERFLHLLKVHVREGRIELLCYSFLTNHFHLVVVSTTGELDVVMHRVMGQYVRFFNDTRERDGPLCRQRYGSVPIRTTRHLVTAFRYLDQNAPDARLAFSGEIYPYGSEYWYRNERRPWWLSTAWADARMGNPPPERRMEAYGESVGRRLRPGEIEAIRERMEHPAAADREDHWDDLIGRAPPHVLAWMREQARLADGTQPGLPYVGPSEIERILVAKEAEEGLWVVDSGTAYALSGWKLLRMALLRDLGGLTYARIARTVGCGRQAPRRAVRRHARLLAEDPLYARRASEAAALCLREDP